MAWIIPILMAMLLSACVAAPAKTVTPAPTINAQVTVCGPHAKLVSRIRDVHGERQERIAILDQPTPQSTELIIEAYVSQKTKTFTILIRHGSDASMACVLVSGVNYHRTRVTEKPDVVSSIGGSSF